ncbi:hypothetical protein RI367_003748 [Sorochytrium milnesiophthora]
MSDSTAATTATAAVGEAAFQHYFGAQYGAERWSTLEAALRAPTRHAALINPFAESAVVKSALERTQGNLQVLSWLSNRCATVVDAATEMPFPRPERDIRNLYNYYLMDAASMMAVEALDVQPGEDILDMLRYCILCAAPGGKSLCIAFRLFSAAAQGTRQGSLTANEPDSDRNERLRQVITAHLPPDAAKRVQIISQNGKSLRRLAQRFDRVLIDAPCSSERHVLRDAQELRKWTSRKTAHMARRQAMLLWSGLGCLHEEGGTLVYATCSLSAIENDQVVKKVLQKMAKLRSTSGKAKKGKHKKAVARDDDDDDDDDGKEEEEDSDASDDDDQDDNNEDMWWLRCDVKITRRQWPFGEPTKYGWLVLPDTAQGWGPLYFCTLRLSPRS